MNSIHFIINFRVQNTSLKSQCYKVLLLPSGDIL